MAGIGFRLKRLIAEESYGGWLRAHLYGAVLSSGPWLLSIFTLASLSLLSRGIVDDPARDLFRTIVAWTYSFSLVTTGALQMVVTRQLADALYLGRLGVVVTAFRWTMGWTALAHLGLGAIFYGLAPGLPLGARLFGVMLLVVVSSTWMAMIFVGAAQDYASVVAAFFMGNAVSAAAALGGGYLWGVEGYLAGFLLGQTAIVFVLAARIEREFPARGDAERLRFGRALRKYRALALAGTCYNAAIVADRVVFWCSAEGRRVSSWFWTSPYDTAVFLAYLSVVPSLTIFLVRVETDFYDRFREYYGAVSKHGTLAQVLHAKERMAECLRESLRRVFLAQGPLSLALIAFAPWIAAGLGLDRLQAAMLRPLLVGAALHILALFGTIILLYFDRRRDAAEVSAIFLVANLVLTAATLWAGPRFYGQGYPMAALLTAAWAYHRLEQTLRDLEYLTFASQPMVPEDQPAAAS